MVVRISLACGDYELVHGLFDGSISVAGTELDLTAAPPAEIFARQRQGSEFDVSEMSLSGHIMRTARGDDEYVGLPIFMNRLFRHSFIYVNIDAGIEGPADLIGKKVGVPEFHMTAALFARGMLRDEYGVRPRDVEWVQAGRVEPGREEREQLSLPADIELHVEKDKSLEEMLEAGEIAAAITTTVPASFGRKGSQIRRLFPDAHQEEKSYYQRTGILPIMHLLVLRRAIHADHPWLAMNLCMAFVRAKKQYYARLRGPGNHHLSSLPFYAHYVEETTEILGEDFCPYGVAPNRSVLELAARYSTEQGLSDRSVPVEELFAGSTLGPFPRD